VRAHHTLKTSSCSHSCPRSVTVPFIAYYSPVLPDTVTTTLYQQAASAALQHHCHLQRATTATTTPAAAALHSAGDDTVLSVLRIAAVLTSAGHVTQVSYYTSCTYCLVLAVQSSDNSAQHYVYCVAHVYSSNTSTILRSTRCHRPYRRELWCAKR
jgi:hypothetical protein